MATNAADDCHRMHFESIRVEAAAQACPSKRLLLSPSKHSARAATLGFLIVAAVPSIWLTDTVIAIMRGWRYSGRMELLVVLLPAVLLLALGAVCCRARARVALGNRWPHFLLAVVSYCFSIGVCEAFLAVQQQPSNRFHMKAPGFTYQFNPNPKATPGIFGQSHYTINSLGIRGPELPADRSVYRILCIGGSTTECI